ncbi:uncharacterized protein LOC135370411 [Ornithodoros turicata]|uniref:uncharacterized protein LOC135370411 n=1 Tax=Ornithodoros turicata TaxID=34597 RepID=UPI003139F4D6
MTSVNDVGDGGRRVYSVVHFEENDEVSVVPSSWLIGNHKVMWPPYKNTNKITIAIKRREKPSHHWKEHRSRVLCECDTYEVARIREQKAAMTSDVATEEEACEPKRKRWRPQPLKRTMHRAWATVPLRTKQTHLLQIHSALHIVFPAHALSICLVTKSIGHLPFSKVKQNIYHNCLPLFMTGPKQTEQTNRNRACLKTEHLRF